MQISRENEAPKDSAQDDQEDQKDQEDHEDHEDHEAAKEKSLEEISPVPEAEEVRQEESKPSARKPMLALPPIPDPSQEDTLVLAVPEGTDKRYIFDEHRILQTPPKYIKKGAEACLFPGLKEDYVSEHSSSGKHSGSHTSDEDWQEDSEQEEEEEQDESVPEPAVKKDESAVNSKSHKKEWMKIDRLVASNPAVYPTISKLWNSGAKERTTVLRQFVSVDGVFEKVESQLSWKASVGSTAKSRKALLTVKQMASAPHFFPAEKIRTIVASREPVKDEDTPHLQSANKYWCTVTATAADFQKSEPGP